MLEERTSPSLPTRQRLTFGFNPQKSKGSRGSILFLGTFPTFFPLQQWTIEEEKQHKGNLSIFHSRNISAVDVLDSRHVSRVDRDMDASLWIERTFWNGALSHFCLTCRQFQIYSIFQSIWAELMDFCKPLLCGCTYCYFVYWNKERSIYKIIKWSSLSSLLGYCICFFKTH